MCKQVQLNTVWNQTHLRLFFLNLQLEVLKSEK